MEKRNFNIGDLTSLFKTVFVFMIAILSIFLGGTFAGIIKTSAKEKKYDPVNKPYISKLPVVYLTTKKNRDITSKTNYVSGTMVIIDNDEKISTIYSGGIKIKGRGNSSWLWPKKPYRLKLDTKTDLFGMGKNRNWVLLSNYLDESLLRNATAFQISERLGLVTMQSVWVDVILNGEYIGNYQLCEQIRLDTDRVDIYDWESEAEKVASAIAKVENKKNTASDKKGKKKGTTIDKDELAEYLKNNLSWVTKGFFRYAGKKFYEKVSYEIDDDISGGYLFELSKEYDEPSKFKTDNNLMVMVKSPENLFTNKKMMKYVKSYWQLFEDAYRSEDGYAISAKGKMFHYTELADIDSMVSFWLIMEIMGNQDAIYKSRFAYKDKGDVIRFGPVWDFDWGCGSSAVGNYPSGWKVSKSDDELAFFKEFTDDPLFICKATEKYWEIRPFLEELVKEGGVLDSEIEYLQESGIADEARWDRTEIWPDEARGFRKDTEEFKFYLIKRLKWLDEQFATDETLLRSLYTVLSASPYTKADDELVMGVLEDENNLLVEIKVNDENTSILYTYVNGILYSTEVPDGGVSHIEISADRLDAASGKNVISIIGKNQNDTTTYRNFITIKTEKHGKTNY